MNKIPKELSEILRELANSEVINQNNDLRKQNIQLRDILSQKLISCDTKPEIGESLLIVWDDKSHGSLSVGRGYWTGELWMGKTWYMSNAKYYMRMPGRVLMYDLIERMEKQTV